MYKLHKNDSGKVVSVTHNGMGIPFDLQNVDYQQFLKDIKDGVELLDADGNVVTDFVKELP